MNAGDEIDYETLRDQAGVNSLHRSGKSQHRRQPVNVDTERQRNPASVRIPPPYSRNDSRDATRLISVCGYTVAIS